MKTAEHRVGSVTATKKLGETIGRRLKGGEVIELVSDLGGGKTQFVHGLAKGIGSRDTVQSPSFTISRVYKVHPEPQLTQSGKAQGAAENRSDAVRSGTASENHKLQRSDLPESRSRVTGSAGQQASAVRELWHFDFYRLGDPGLMRLELAEAIDIPGTVVAIEWAERVVEVLPSDRLVVEITATGKNSRQVVLEATGPGHSHLLS